MEIIDDIVMKGIIKVVTLITENELGIDNLDLNGDFTNDLGCDSLERITVITKVESKYNMKSFNTDELEDIKTPQNLIDMTWAKVKL